MEQGKLSLYLTEMSTIYYMFFYKHKLWLRNLKSACLLIFYLNQEIYD